MSATVSPDQILKELSELWVTMGKQGQAEAGASVLRACSMTLVVLAEESDDPSALGETVAALMPEHPARAILVRLSGKPQRELSERVYTQCWMPFGQRRQICCEQVEITAGDPALADLPSVVRPLAVADLPVILWCRATRLLGMPEFGEIAAVARKVIVDSAGMGEATAALRRLRTARECCVLGDLAWTRLTRWREILSQVFENHERLAQLAAVQQARVTYAPGFETAARYLATWIGAAIAAPVTAEAGPAETIRVELGGPGLRVELARHDDTLAVVVNELSYSTRLPRPTDYVLMREELSIIQSDLVFDRTLASAAQ